MPRYLTPSKIGLLALVSIYSESKVPIGSTIPILSFIVGHLMVLKEPSDDITSDHAGRAPNPVFSIEDLQKATITHASAIPGRTIWDLLLKALWEINSFDALNVFFEKHATLVVKSREELRRGAEQGIVPSPDAGILFSRSSPIGMHLRRARFEFTRLQFDDAVALWRTFVIYREPTLGMWKKRNPAVGETSFDVNIESAQLGWDDPLTSVVYGGLLDGTPSLEGIVSTDDVERLLDFQVKEMQSMLAVCTWVYLRY